MSLHEEFKNNKRLAEFIAYKFVKAYSHLDIEETLQEAYKGLWRAIVKGDCNKSSYIKWEILKFIDRGSTLVKLPRINHRTKDTLDQCAFYVSNSYDKNDNEFSEHFENKIRPVEDISVYLDKKLDIEFLAYKFSEEEKIMLDLYNQDRPQEEIAQVIGITQPELSRRLRKLINKLKKYLK